MGTDGTVGRFHLGQTPGSAIEAALGPPDATSHGMAGAFTPQPFSAFGYECAPSSPDGVGDMSPAAHPLAAAGQGGARAPTPGSGPYCQTISFLNSAGLLASFFSDSASFATANGTKVGMSTAEAEGREGESATTACYGGIIVSKAGPAMVLVGIPSASDPIPATTPVRGLEADAGLGLLQC